MKTKQYFEKSIKGVLHKYKTPDKKAYYTKDVLDDKALKFKSIRMTKSNDDIVMFTIKMKIIEE